MKTISTAAFAALLISIPAAAFAGGITYDPSEDSAAAAIAAVTPEPAPQVVRPVDTGHYVKMTTETDASQDSGAASIVQTAVGSTDTQINAARAAAKGYSRSVTIVDPAQDSGAASIVSVDVGDGTVLATHD